MNCDIRVLFSWVWYSDSDIWLSLVSLEDKGHKIMSQMCVIWVQYFCLLVWHLRSCLNIIWIALKHIYISTLVIVKEGPFQWAELNQRWIYEIGSLCREVINFYFFVHLLFSQNKWNIFKTYYPRCSLFSQDLVGKKWLSNTIHLS